MIELMNGARSILEVCKAVKPGEDVLIIADNEGEPLWLGQIVMNVVNSMGAEPVLIVINPPEFSGQEPPESVAVAMKSADAIFRLTNRTAQVHTTARKEATAAGARYHPWTNVLLDELKKGVSAADVLSIKERSEDLAGRLTQANMARVTSPAGTDITMSLASREGLALHSMSPVVAGLPDYAEAAIAPLEGTAEGIIVGDLSIVQWGYIFREPLRCAVKAGKVQDISGGKQDVEKLRKIMSTYESANNIAELGIGTSHIVPLPMLGIRRDAARIGTAHIGMGRNNDIGGTVWSHMHLDTLMDGANVELDGKPVLKDGALLI
ncbi:MAG: hypothetical protein JSW12_19655 [Deltaproteobacteria bacterium]|nr:MAG: hypothetical protein JSW12_19655 [Deltaproteobacteria bacterium]